MAFTQPHDNLNASYFPPLVKSRSPLPPPPRPPPLKYTTRAALPSMSSEGSTGGKPASSTNSSRHKPPPSSSSSCSPCYSPARTLLSQENLDVFVAAAVKLLPMSLTLAAPRPPDAAATTTAAPGGRPPRDGVADGGFSAAGSRGTKRSGRRSTASAGLGSPYEEVECLGMVLECLVEACTESLDSGAW